MTEQTPSNSHRTAAAILLCLTAVARLATGEVGPPPTAYLDMAQDYTFAKRGQSMVVMFDGNLVRESYTNGGGPDRLQFLASATKGFTGMIGAMAADDGIIGLDDSLADVLTEWQQGDPNLALIRYRHALTMSSGLAETKKPSGWADYVNQAVVIHPAGTFFNYSGDPNVFGAALQRALQGETVEAYMQRRLFQPLGIQVSWQYFTDGNPVVGGGAFVRPIEWIRFGEFVRLGGVWQGQPLLAAQFFDQVFQASGPNPVYGLYWWLKKPITEEEAGRIMEEGHVRRVFPLTQAAWVPDDLVMALGAFEQALYVMPSLKLVALRNGPKYTQDDPELLYDDIEFLSRLLRGQPAAAAPVITSKPITDAMVGKPYTYAVSKTGWPLPTVTATGLPKWLTLTGTGIGSTLSGTPDSAGTFGPITLTASNGVSPAATQTFSITVIMSASVTLRNGYNLITLPVRPWGTPFTAESLAQHLAANSAPPVSCTSVIRYVSASGQFETHPVGTAVSNFEIAVGIGYFIRCQVAGPSATWTLTGCPLSDPSAQLALAGGYNLIGLPRQPASPYTAEEAGIEINGQQGSATQIIRYDAETGQFVTHPIGTAVANFTLKPGEGYFIRCGGPSTWSLNRP